MAHEADMELAARALAGDREAWNAILVGGWRTMHHLALKMTRNPALADDIVQEACVKALRYLSQYQGNAAIKSWLGRIVVNEVLLRHRRDKRLVLLEDPYQGMSAPLSHPNPGNEIDVQAQLDLIWQIVAKRRKGDLDLFERRFLLGHSMERICREAGLTMPALKSRLYRIRKAIELEFRRRRISTPLPSSIVADNSAESTAEPARLLDSTLDWFPLPEVLTVVPVEVSPRDAEASESIRETASLRPRFRGRLIVKKVVEGTPLNGDLSEITRFSQELGSAIQEALNLLGRSS